jgi:hypothetical protein
MNLIEQWFGVSPDGGDGSLEVLYIVAAVALVATIVFRASIRRLIKNLHRTHLLGGD